MFLDTRIKERIHKEARFRELFIYIINMNISEETWEKRMNMTVVTHRWMWHNGENLAVNAPSICYSEIDREKKENQNI